METTTTERTTWMDEHGVRTCPRCGATFDGTHIGAAAEARILCSECTLRALDERRDDEKLRRRSSRRAR